MRPDSQDQALFDYSLLRFPQLYELARQLCLESPCINAATENLPESICNNLVSRGVLDQAQGNELAFGSNVESLLKMTLRFADRPSETKSLPIKPYKSVVGWILNQLKKDQIEIDEGSISENDLPILLEGGVLVRANPPAKATFPPDSFESNNPAPSIEDIIAVSDTRTIQPEKEATPQSVLAMLGQHLPELPSGKKIFWGRHAGSRIPLCKVVSASEEAGLDDWDAGQNKKSREKQKKIWRDKLTAEQVKFQRNSYSHLTEIIPAEAIPFLKQHMRNLIDKNYFGQLGDVHVARRQGIHNEPVTGMLHHRISKLVSAIVGEDLMPSYNYLSLYLGGADLPKHIDREQCAYNCSIVFDMYDENRNDVDPWPIYLQTPARKTVAVRLNIGDGVIYRGSKLAHWRDPLPANQNAVVCFYHFVDKNYKGSLV